MKIGRFSWVEYLILIIGMGVLSALPAFLFGGFSYIVETSKTYLGWYIVYWVFVCTIICGLTALIRYRAFDKPLRNLSKAAKQVANGDFSVYIQPLHTRNNVNYLDAMFMDFNKMVAELGSIETMKNDFISNVSHEIKTPLAIVKNYTTALKQENLSEELRQEYMETIILATDKLTSLVTNILKLNKVENQEILPQKEAYNLCRQLCDCAIYFESIMEEKQMELEVELEEEANIFAEESMLEIVWNNLLSNALKFTPNGGKVTIRQVSDSHSITVIVTDTGCGMDQETMTHIFEKFYQSDTSHSCEGNGLGLALAYRVVDRMGGTISVISRPEKGSTFTVILPIIY